MADKHKPGLSRLRAVGYTEVGLATSVKPDTALVGAELAREEAREVATASLAIERLQVWLGCLFSLDT